MALINTSVPNLIQGVSQQPDPSRYPGQCEEQENALSSVAKGLLKRPNTKHIGKLITSAIDSDSFVHFINRNEGERYAVITYKEHDSNNEHTHCKIRAFNLVDGTEASITVGGVEYNASFLNITNPDTDSNYTQSEIDADSTKSNTSYILNDTNTPYLHSSDPRNHLKGLTIGDTTLLLNTRHSVAPKTEKTTPLVKEGLVTILQGAYDKKYIANAVVVPEGAAQQPSNLVMPTFQFTLSRYEYSKTLKYKGSRGGRAYTTRYRWRVTGYNITNAGANLDAGVNITFSSSLAIYTQPVIRANIVNGSVTSLTIRNKGSFEGSGYRNLLPYAANKSSDYYGETAPSNFAHVVSGGFISTQTNFTATATSGSATSGTNTNANTGTIAGQLVSSMTSNGWANSFTINRQADDASVYITLTTQADADFTLSTTDDLANGGMKGIYKEIDSISSLPIKNKNGFRIKVKGDVRLAEDDYYVEFQTNQGQAFGEGSYVETVGFDIVSGFEPSTMPHSLINNAVNSFILEETNFEDRLAGDDISNPLPSFVGSEIEAMFFFKNRLGFLSKENIIMSEAGFGVVNDAGKTVFNFGRTSVTTLLDSAPIDISVASSRVTSLKAAKGFQENLILFAENGQFVLKSGDILTSKTVSVTPITNFSVEDQVEPLPLGSYLYFPFTRGNFTGLREFTVTRNTDNYDSVEVTEHVPAYIPSGVVAMTGTTSEDMIVLLADTTYSDGTNSRNCLYVYNYFWNNNQKILSSWSKFSFDGEIVGLTFMDSTLYIVLTKNDETNLVEMSLEAGLKDDAGFNTYLDMRVDKTVSAGSNEIVLPYTPSNNSVEVYTKDGLRLNATNTGATVALAQAVTADTEVFIGIPYTMKYTFSEQIFKAKAANGQSPSNAANLMVRNGSLYFDDTAFFKVKVTPQDRQTYENVFTPDVVGSTTIGSLNLDSGFFRFPVFTKPQDTTITIENDSALPSNFQSAEFESFVHSRSNRYG